MGANPSRLISYPPPSSPIFIPAALPAATLPLYPGLGQAPNMLTCILVGWLTQWDHFPGEPGLAIFHLDFLSPLVYNRCILLGQNKTFHILCNIMASSTSLSLISFYLLYCPIFDPMSTSLCLKHPNLPFLVTKLTGSNPIKSPSSAFLWPPYVIGGHYIFAL